MSVIALTITFVKWMQFSWLRVNSSHGVLDSLQHWRNGDGRATLEQLERKKRRPTARVVSTAVRGLMQGHSEALVREEVTRVAKDQIEGLKSWLRPLELIATLSPLLGLFGTVLGMIEAFQKLEQAGSAVDPSILSGGIWQALLTTAVGLAVAIPATLAHSWLERCTERAAHAMEDAATRVFTTRAVASVQGS